MALFGKKEETYEIFLNYKCHIRLEDDVMPVLFNQCKTFGLPLIEEPIYNGVNYIFKLKGDVSGIITYSVGQNASILKFFRSVSSPVSEDILAKTVVEFFKQLSRNNIPFTISAYKKGKRKDETWEAVMPPRRTFM